MQTVLVKRVYLTCSVYVLQMDYSTGGKAEKEVKEEMDMDESQKEQKHIPESKLDDRVQALLKLICDIRAMEEAVTELEYDAVKAPLGMSIFAVIFSIGNVANMTNDIYI